MRQFLFFFFLFDPNHGKTFAEFSTLESGCKFAAHLFYYEAKLLSLKWKACTKRLLGYLPL
jgi:hypothetical protein